MQLQDMSKKEGVIILAGSVELATGDFDRIQEGLVFWNLLGLFPMGIHPLCLSLSYGFMSDSVMVLSGKKVADGQFVIADGPLFAMGLLLTQFCMASAAV